VWCGVRICIALYVIAFTSVPCGWRPNSNRSPKLQQGVRAQREAVTSETRVDDGAGP